MGWEGGLDVPVRTAPGCTAITRMWVPLDERRVWSSRVQRLRRSFDRPRVIGKERWMASYVSYAVDNYEGGRMWGADSDRSV